jgi:hypothetical protein
VGIRLDLSAFTHPIHLRDRFEPSAELAMLALIVSFVGSGSRNFNIFASYYDEKLQWSHPLMAWYETSFERQAFRVLIRNARKHN